jgi:hypothetical protein
MKKPSDPIDKTKEPKQVTFAEKLIGNSLSIISIKLTNLIVNEDSLDLSMLERMKHNLEYNDDRMHLFIINLFFRYI